VRRMKQDLEKNAHGTTPVFIAVAKKYQLNLITYIPYNI